MENKTVSENELIAIRIFFPTFLSLLRLRDEVTHLSLRNIRLLWCNKKGQKLIWGKK